MARPPGSPIIWPSAARTWPLEHRRRVAAEIERERTRIAEVGGDSLGVFADHGFGMCVDCDARRIIDIWDDPDDGEGPWDPESWEESLEDLLS